MVVIVVNHFYHLIKIKEIIQPGQIFLLRNTNWLI